MAGFPLDRVIEALRSRKKLGEAAQERASLQRTLLELLAKGRPVTVSRLATTVRGLPLERAREVFEQLPCSEAEFNKAGELIGATISQGSYAPPLLCERPGALLLVHTRYALSAHADRSGGNRHLDLPVAISFAVETDGRLPTGQGLGSAIEEVDAATCDGPAYHVIDCAHPIHFETLLDPGEPWVARIQGIRANASTMSHAELDEAEELDDGDPVQLGRQYAQLRSRLGTFNIMGGCCGTHHRHIEQISSACAPLF